MTKSASKNLGLGIESGTRKKMVLQVKNSFGTFVQELEAAEAIKTVNAGRPITMVRDLGFDGDGSDLLLSVSALMDHGDDTAFYKALAQVRQRTNALKRAILQFEECVNGNLGGNVQEFEDDYDDAE